jgi:hypothetical protein
MHTALSSLLFCLFGVLLPNNASAQSPVADDHPLIGKWQWTRPVNKCTEVFDFRADGTAPVTSGDEKTENTYSISSSADRNGFYQLNMKTIKDFGGKDCGDDSSDTTGQETTHFVLFEPQRTMHIVCAEPKVGRCYGPLTRMP